MVTGIDSRHRPYKPFGGSERLFYCRDLVVLIEGPAGTGKRTFLQLRS